MAAARSPSPNPSRPSPSYPSPKTLENSSVLRKSGTLSPSKPCISSEIPQRNSNSKFASTLPSSRASFEQKENERDLNCSKPARTRSPAMNPSKGMKSFMAPTISASSKITAASPRKKIFSERNEVVMEMEMKSPRVSVEGVRVEEIRPNPEIGFDSEEISGRNRSKMMDFSVSRGHYQSAGTHYSSCCPLDADPSLPPYDPMTNYLSPRPQFLHYKPKAKIEQNHGVIEDLFDAGDGRRLEDSFSDTDGSDDCSEYTEGTKSSPVNKEPEDEYPSTMLNTEEAQVPVETHVSEPEPRAENKEPEDEYPSTMLNTEEAQVPVETHVSKPEPRAETCNPRIYNRSFRKSKLIPFLLVLSIVFFCLPLADLPILPPSIMKYESSAGPHTQSFGVLEDAHLKDYLTFTSRNIQGLISRMRQWLIDSIAVLSSSGSISRKESDMCHSINLTLSTSIVQNVGFDFGYSSELDAIRKKEIVEGRNNPDMESAFELDKIARDVLVGINDGEKIKIEFSDVNGDVARDEMMQDQEEDKYPNYEEGLNSFTDPVVEFETMSKKDQSKKMDVAISEEIGEAGYPVGFEIVQMLEEQVLVDLKQNNSHSKDENIKFELADVNEDGTGEKMVQKEEEDNYPKYEEGLSSFMDQPNKIDIAISEEVNGEYLMQLEIVQKLEEEVLMELRPENSHPITKDDIDSSIDLVLASQMMNQKDNAGIVNFLSEVQPSVFVDANLILAVLGVLVAVLAITLVSLFMKQKHTRATSDDDKLLKNKKGPVSSGAVSCRDYSDSPYHNLTELVEVVGDSGPTEMSSSLNNSFSVGHQRRKRASHEVTPNHETLQRRESGVSSSISYGSFTAFEKVSSRKSEKDEEVMTPVRRSSRIRNQVISP